MIRHDNEVEFLEKNMPERWAGKMRHEEDELKQKDEAGGLGRRIVLNSY